MRLPMCINKAGADRMGSKELKTEKQQQTRPRKHGKQFKGRTDRPREKTAGNAKQSIYRVTLQARTEMRKKGMKEGRKEGW